MARYCVFPGCDRRLKSGWKYCYEHRGYKDPDEIVWRKQDFKPSKGYWIFIIIMVAFILLALSLVRISNLEHFVFFGIAALVSYLFFRLSKKGYEKSLSKYEEDPEAYNEKRWKARYKMAKWLKKPMASGRTTNIGKPFTANAQSGIDGMFR